MADESEIMTAEDLAAKGVPVDEPPAVNPPTQPAEPPPADTHCPNCDAPGIRKGKLIICEVCNASFRFTKEGPKVEELGPFDKLDARVTFLEKEHSATVPPAEPPKAPAAEPPEPAAPAAEPIEDDDGI